MQGWEGIVARLDGPLHFRFIGQPLMASILAIIDGVKDARRGKPAFFWALIADPAHRKELIKDAWKSICKVSIFAMLFEAIYQVMNRRLDFQGQVLVAAFALAIFPYVLLRGPTNRVVRALWKKKEALPGPR